MRKIFCDRCGKDITDEEKIGSAVFRWKDQEGHFIVSEAAVGYDSDYCPACMELMTTVASKIQAVEKTKPKKKAAAAAADQDAENEPKKPAKKDGPPRRSRSIPAKSEHCTETIGPRSRLRTICASRLTSSAPRSQ